MAKQAKAGGGGPAKAKGRKPAKARPRTRRSGAPDLAAELETARRRIRELEQLHAMLGERLDAAVETIHKILARLN